MNYIRIYDTKDEVQAFEEEKRLGKKMRKMTHIMFLWCLLIKIHLEMKLGKKQESSDMKLLNLCGKRDKLLW